MEKTGANGGDANCVELLSRVDFVVVLPSEGLGDGDRFHVAHDRDDEDSRDQLADHHRRWDVHKNAACFRVKEIQDIIDSLGVEGFWLWGEFGRSNLSQK